MNIFVSFVCGVIFAVGLAIAGMTQPQKILGFLNVFGEWDASLLFVMLAAVAVHASAYALIRRRKSPLLDTEFHVPKGTPITKSLIVGSILFGIGWALGGFCPGPAIVSIAALTLRPIVFLVSMIAGMFIFRKFGERLR